MPTFTGTTGNDTLVGTTANDEIFGLEGNDILDGLEGDDLLDGGAGNDTITDGAGSDTVLGGTGSDTIVAVPGAGNDSYDGGTGAATEVDVVVYSQALAGIIVDLSLASGQARSQGTTDAAGIGVDQLIGIEGVTATAFRDTLIGNDGNNVFSGREGADTIQAGAGDDVINGGDGDDLIDGGAGLDRASYSNATKGVTVSLLISAAQATGQGRDTLVGIENLTGSDFADTLIGSDGANALNGGEGDDRLQGGLGNDELLGGLGVDRLIGGGGDDTYLVRDATDYAYENAGEGLDTVVSTVNHALRANIENLRLGGTAISGTGNDLANVITGNDLNNRLSGLAGDDSLIGGVGNDVLDGGVGVDQLAGGVGNDTYLINDATDIITEARNEGTDRVYATVSHTLRNNVENLVLTGTANINGVGNAANNLLQGNDGANALYGQDGADRLFGAGGTDYLDGGANGDSLEGGAGRDRFLGGTGADSFVFKDGDFAGVGSAADQIIDFSRADGDLIRLDAVDADVATAGDQAFSFLGDAAFTGAAGQLRYEQISGNTYIQGDTNGDGVADFWIRLDGLYALAATDLIL